MKIKLRNEVKNKMKLCCENKNFGYSKLNSSYDEKIVITAYPVIE